MKFAASLSLLMMSPLAILGADTVPAEQAPSSSSISWETAMADAKALAARHANMSVLYVEGVSSRSYFGNGSMLVVKQIDIAKLREGMMVVYQNHFGQMVACRLVTRTHGGWQVKDWNNHHADSAMVDTADLLGVVYAIFYPPVKLHGAVLYATDSNKMPAAPAN